MSDCSSWWERSATAWARGSPTETPAKDQSARRKYLVNGEPTKTASLVASKGTLRAEVTASGRMAHSLIRTRQSAIEVNNGTHPLAPMPLPSDAQFGPCTLNIGLIEGGRPQRDSRLRHRFALSPRRSIARSAAPDSRNCCNEVKVDFPWNSLPAPAHSRGPAYHIAAFTHRYSCANQLGRPLLIGPGSIHVLTPTESSSTSSNWPEAIDCIARLAKAGWFS